MTTGSDQRGFVLDSNLGLPVRHGEIADVLRKQGFAIEGSADLGEVARRLAAHDADIAFVPSGMFHRLFAQGDRFYDGLVLAASKFTGDVTIASLLIVHSDDEAESIDDLEGAPYGYINKACSSTWYPAEILLAAKGRRPDRFFDAKTVNPGSTWQGLVDAVVEGAVRATMVLEDVWRTQAENAARTRVIDRYAGTKGPVLLVRRDLSASARNALREALLDWFPEWDAVYGGFKPFYLADVRPWFHDLDRLAEDQW